MDPVRKPKKEDEWDTLIDRHEKTRAAADADDPYDYSKVVKIRKDNGTESTTLNFRPEARSSDYTKVRLLSHISMFDAELVVVKVGTAGGNCNKHANDESTDSEYSDVVICNVVWYNIVENS